MPPESGGDRVMVLHFLFAVNGKVLTAECFFVQPRRADALPGLRIATALHEKGTPGEAPGVGVVCVSGA